MKEVNRAFSFKQQCEKNDTALRESIGTSQTYRSEVDDNAEIDVEEKSVISCKKSKSVVIPGESVIQNKN